MENEKVVRKWDIDLQNYSESLVPKFQNKLKLEGSKYESIVKKLYDLYILYSFIVDEKLSTRKNTFSAIMLFYGKSSHSILGIYNCLKNGLVSEAVILLRNVFEILVNVKLILEKDVEERIKLWDNFRFVSDWNNYQSNLNLLSEGILTLNQFEKTFNTKFIKEIELNYNKVKGNYHPKFPYH
jgi:hypothetical protein